MDDFELDLVDPELALVVVDNDISKSSLVGIKHVLVELNIKTRLALSAALAGGNVHLLLLKVVFLEGNRWLMDDEHLLVSEKGVVIVHDRRHDRVLHGSLWIILVFLVLEHDTCRQSQRKSELEWDDVITRSQWLCESVAYAVELQVLLLHLLIVKDSLKPCFIIYCSS